MTVEAYCQTNLDIGPLFDEFPLTLAPGHRTEILGPLFYDQLKESERTWALPPIFSHDADPAVESREDDLFYPLLSYECYGTQYRWQFVQVFSLSGGEDPDNAIKHRITIFPIYFQQRSADPEKNYTAVFPFYGDIRNRLFRDEIYFIMFPVFSETHKHGIVNDNYFYPFFNVRHGDGMHGWQIWPLFGEEHKVVTTKTNGWGDVETVPGHDQYFVLWPIHFWQNTGIGTADPAKFRATLPFYDYLRSPNRDSTTVLWPFFTWTVDREKKYWEWDGPYPFVVVARGPGKTATRFLPLFERAHNGSQERDYYLWPAYKFSRVQGDTLDRKRTRIFYYLFQNVTEKNKETGKEKERIDLWPLFVYHRDFDGDSRLQLIAPIESMLPNNRGVERNWSPVWSIWRSENNPNTGASSQSLLWNLYRHAKTPESKKISLLFGLFQYQSSPEREKLRLFFIPVINSHKQTVHLAGRVK